MDLKLAIKDLDMSDRDCKELDLDDDEKYDRPKKIPPPQFVLKTPPDSAGTVRKLATELKDLVVLSIQFEGRKRYRVLFEGGQDFVFTVNTEIVPTVTWTPDFRSALHGDLKQARPLFNIILSFHANRTSSLARLD